MQLLFELIALIFPSSSYNTKWNSRLGQLNRKLDKYTAISSFYFGIGDKNLHLITSNAYMRINNNLPNVLLIISPDPNRHSREESRQPDPQVMMKLTYPIIRRNINPQMSVPHNVSVIRYNLSKYPQRYPNPTKRLHESDLKKKPCPESPA